MFLGWLSAEPDKVPLCRPVLEAAESGNIVIVTSALTITEVLWIKGYEKISATHAKKIEAFFKHSWIVVRELDRFIAEDARELVWNKNVKPKDAIHLATALRQDVQLDQFDTFDNGLIRLSGTLGEPGLTIGPPGLPPKLPFEAEPDEE
ncbi:MAG: type II toxin-antitoxin system VapC family toxin [Vicinamibacterales bacterium]